eukprot:9495-Pelagococcus_subviridis.AAC.1
MASEPRIALRVSLFFSALSSVMNAFVMASSLKSPASPPSCSRESALAGRSIRANVGVEFKGVSWR